MEKYCSIVCIIWAGRSKSALHLQHAFFWLCRQEYIILILQLGFAWNIQSDFLLIKITSIFILLSRIYLFIYLVIISLKDEIWKSLDFDTARIKCSNVISLLFSIWWNFLCHAKQIDRYACIFIFIVRKSMKDLLNLRKILKNNLRNSILILTCPFQYFKINYFLIIFIIYDLYLKIYKKFWNWISSPL